MIVVMAWLSQFDDIIVVGQMAAVGSNFCIFAIVMQEMMIFHLYLQHTHKFL